MDATGIPELHWKKRPKNVLVIKKQRSSSVLVPFLELLSLLKMENLSLYLEENIKKDEKMKTDPSFTILTAVPHAYITLNEENKKDIDLVITLGGDGTLVYAATLFQEQMPPVVSFFFGSYGFLTPFEFYNFRDSIRDIFEGKVQVLLRTRLSCILKKGEVVTKKATVLNDVVIRRPFISNIKNKYDLSVNGKILGVSGDGLIISTPTGSSAYAASAGSSLLHPEVPAILISPICSHTLSFRSIMVPHTSIIKLSIYQVHLTVTLSPKGRSTAYVSFDGRKSIEISHGDSVTISVSDNPVPCLCKRSPTSDWVDSVVSCMDWSVSGRQENSNASLN